MYSLFMSILFNRNCDFSESFLGSSDEIQKPVASCRSQVGLVGHCTGAALDIAGDGSHVGDACFASSLPGVYPLVN